MIDKHTAQSSVLEFINKNVPLEKERIILEDSTIEKDYGWVFFWNSRKYVETGILGYAVAGNSPILVLKENGLRHALGTGTDVKDELKKFEAHRKMDKLSEAG